MRRWLQPYAGSLAALVLALVLIGVTRTYVPTLNAYFHADDFVALVDLVNKPIGQHLWDVLTFQDRDFYWRPLGHVYYQAIYQLFGLNPFWFRLANLGLFLVSIALLFRLCVKLGASPWIGVGSAALFGFHANHVVSVAWISNGPRLLAGLLLLASVLATIRAVQRRSRLHEVAAYGSFLGACLADEVTLALAPIPVLTAILLFRNGERAGSVWPRILPYAITVAVLLPLQFIFTPDDEPRLVRYHLSWDVLEQGWALASQLVLPLASANPMDVPFTRIGGVQWAAGGAAVVLGAVVLAAGSGLMRFLVVWVCLALAPFSLWDYDLVAPRYVYLAAIPFSIFVSVLAGAVVRRMRRPAMRTLAGGAVAATLAVTMFLGVTATIERNGEFERAIRPFEVLGTGMKHSIPIIPRGARVLIYFGIWDHYPVWPAVVLQTVYRDPSLRIVNVRPSDVGRAAPPGPNDFPVYYLGGQFSRHPGAVRQ